MVNLQATAARLLQTVSEALSDALRPVCKEYHATGIPVIENCCECDDEGSTGELSVQFQRIYDADPQTLNEVVRTRPCKRGVVAAKYRLVLARCYPTINERGEVPDEETLTEYANNQMLDVQIMWAALNESGMVLRIDDISADPGPMGGCSIFYADITVQVDSPTLADCGSG